MTRIRDEAESTHSIDYSKWKSEYQSIIKNYLEPEYQISKNNTFDLIMDENLHGKDAYFGLIDDHCVLE